MPELWNKPPEQRYPKLSVDVVNQIICGLTRVITGDGVMLKKIGDRFVIENDTSDYIYPDDEIQNVTVIEELADYVACVLFYFSNTPQNYSATLGTDQQTAGLTGSLIYVAKPYWLQQTAFDNTTVIMDGLATSLSFTGVGSRVAVIEGQGTFNQYLSPSYFSGDILMAKLGATGLTDPDGNLIQWMDVNTAARSWVDEIIPSPPFPVIGINNYSDADALLDPSTFKLNIGLNENTLIQPWNPNQQYSLGWLVRYNTNEANTPVWQSLSDNLNVNPTTDVRSNWVQVSDGMTPEVICINIPAVLSVTVGTAGSDLNIAPTLIPDVFRPGDNVLDWQRIIVNLPDASPIARGAMTIGTQYIAGTKYFIAGSLFVGSYLGEVGSGSIQFGPDPVVYGSGNYYQMGLRGLDDKGGIGIYVGYDLDEFGNRTIGGPNQWQSYAILSTYLQIPISLPPSIVFTIGGPSNLTKAQYRVRNGDFIFDGLYATDALGTVFSGGIASTVSQVHLTTGPGMLVQASTGSPYTLAPVPAETGIPIWDSAAGSFVFATVGSNLTYNPATQTLSASGGGGGGGTSNPAAFGFGGF